MQLAVKSTYEPCQAFENHAAVSKIDLSAFPGPFKPCHGLQNRLFSLAKS
jgi:hypothetical protein